MSGLFPYTTRPNTVVTGTHNQLSICLFNAAAAIVGKHNNVNAFVAALTNELQTQLAKKYELPTGKVDTDIQFLENDRVIVGARLGGDDNPITIIVDLFYLLDFMDTVWDFPVDVGKLALDMLDQLELGAKEHAFADEQAVVDAIRAHSTAALEGQALEAIISGKDTEHLYTFFVIDKSGHANKLGTYDLSQYVQIKLTRQAEGFDEHVAHPASTAQDSVTSPHDYSLLGRVSALVDASATYPKEGVLLPTFTAGITAAWEAISSRYATEQLNQVSSRALAYAMADLEEWLTRHTSELLENLDREFNYTVNGAVSRVEVTLTDVLTGQTEIAVFDDTTIAEYLAHGLDWNPRAPTFWIPQTRQFSEQVTPVQ